MQYDADTPSAYLEMLEDDWRKERLLQVRDLMLAVDGIEESIGYKMLRFGRGEAILAHLNAQKAYVGVYLGDVSALDPKGEITSDMNVGKGCVRLRKTDTLDGIRELIERKANRFQTR